MRLRRVFNPTFVGSLLWAFLLGLALAHALHLFPLAWVTQLERALDDARLRTFASESAPRQIVLVDIDERSLVELGRWPWRRDRIATLLDELFDRQGAAAVGFDLVFAEPDTGDLPAVEALAQSSSRFAGPASALLPELRRQLDRDRVFADALKQRRVVLAHYFTSDRGGLRSGSLPAAAVPGPAPAGLTQWNGHGASLAALAQAAPRAGFINALPDDDGVLRSAAMFVAHEGQVHAALSLQLWRAARGDPPLALRSADSPSGRVLLGFSAGDESFSLDERGAVRVPYRRTGGPQSEAFERVSAADLIGERTPDHTPARIPARALAGRIVLVGTSVPSLADLRATPIHAALPGVEVHASVLAGLIEGRLPWQPDWARGYEALTLILLALLLAFSLRSAATRGRRAAALAALLGPTLVAINLWAYTRHAIVLPLAASLLFLAAGLATTLAWGYAVETRARRSLTQLFGSYVPPTLVARMASDPERYIRQALQAENRELSILFCDLRGFTTMSEHLDPQALRELLNRFFSRMSALVHAEGGTLDKFIGDALMAFWGAPLDEPRHAERALRTALAMQVALAELNADGHARGLPPLGLGIGIHTGMACVGDMGSDLRRAYTALGDSVNLASRVEGLTRQYGVDLLVTAATRDAASAALPGVAFIEVDDVTVKGRGQAVTVFTALEQAVTDGPNFERQMRLWSLALEARRSHHWQHAHDALEALREATQEGEVLRALGDQLSRQIEAPASAI